MCFFLSNPSVDVCNTLLSRDLKRNLFNLFASWSGQYAKPLGVSSSSVANEDEKLQFCALQVSFLIFNSVHSNESDNSILIQAMSALLCCGSCFDTQNLGEDGNIYFWLDLLLTSSDDKVSNEASIIRFDLLGRRISHKLDLPFFRKNFSSIVALCEL